jgi:hypothetical protein
MRYLSPAYLPMLVIGVYAFKHAGLDADGVRESLKTLNTKNASHHRCPAPLEGRSPISSNYFHFTPLSLMSV